MLIGVVSVNGDELELVLWVDPLFELLLDEVGLFVMLKVLCVGLVPLVGRLYVLRGDELLVELELVP